jgi:hypothetical protein
MTPVGGNAAECRVRNGFAALTICNVGSIEEAFYDEGCLQPVCSRSSPRKAAG